MTFGQTEATLLVAFVFLWWLFYFGVRMRADQKYIKSNKSDDMRPCQGCMITQSAMLAAATVVVMYGIYIMEWVSFSR